MPAVRREGSFALLVRCPGEQSTLESYQIKNVTGGLLVVSKRGSEHLLKKASKGFSFTLFIESSNKKKIKAKTRGGYARCKSSLSGLFRGTLLTDTKLIV